ncbi:Tn3 family transposase [Streptomyces sp. NPDC056831]|uniref:Tn3 family transposase n=1 Tax=Streptomyces sp. NPDC056831 TaxID=3345954 RepID=UPI003690BD38
MYGKDGDLAGAAKESQEVSMLALHLLQSALVHVNTLLMQEVLADPKWADRLTDADRRALSPLFWTHVNPYLDDFSVGDGLLVEASRPQHAGDQAPVGTIGNRLSSVAVVAVHVAGPGTERFEVAVE